MSEDQVNTAPEPMQLRAPAVIYHSLNNDVVDSLDRGRLEELNHKDLVVLLALLEHSASAVRNEVHRRRGPNVFPEPF